MCSCFFGKGKAAACWTFLIPCIVYRLCSANVPSRLETEQEEKNGICDLRYARKSKRQNSQRKLFVRPEGESTSVVQIYVYNLILLRWDVIYKSLCVVSVLLL